jgi:hypothetical protein
MREETGEYGLDRGEDQDLPRVVEEAHEVLAAYHLQLGGTAAVACVAWLVADFVGTTLPLTWLVVALTALFILVLAPVTREPRLAKDVLRRWDALRVDRALASSGVSTDPRLEVAESMVDRIVRHPASGERVRSATSAMLRRLRRLLDDLQRTRYLARAQLADERHELSRSVSDLQDLLDARVADVLAQLAHLHRTVVLRDTASLERVVGAVEDLVHELEAEHEVERLLSSAESE